MSPEEKTRRKDPVWIEVSRDQITVKDAEGPSDDDG